MNQGEDKGLVGNDRVIDQREGFKGAMRIDRGLAIDAVLLLPYERLT